MDALTRMLLNLTLGGSAWVLGLLLVLSLASVAVMLERAWVFYRHRFPQTSFLSDLEPLLLREQWEEAADLCRKSAALEAKVLLAGLGQVDRGREAVQEAMEAERIKVSLLLEKHLSFLGTLGANAPFIGLFGTVLGIIHAFKDLSLAEGGGGPAVMAGIAEALVATAVGLLVAIPAVVMYNLFHRRLHVVLERSRHLSQLLLTYLAPEARTPEIPLPARQAGGRR
jgi:biopolymer transport protein ExbB|uniref:MotA/TolQ/ExbB proton channel family protein n=1 Tax=Desulfobacca acetoxidans TaxID=60893 RepID=A0A7C5ENJ4_9BACT